MAEQTILVTGGAGFIGSHTVVQLLKEGFRVSIIDNLDNSITEAVDRVRELVGPALSQKLEFNKGDIRNKDDLEKLFSRTKFDAVIHFAGLKAVGESVAYPRRYFDNNLIGTINLYEVMTKYNCKKMVFSSSATVYGQPEKIPCVEDFQLMAMNPYGRTKLFLEEISRDIQKAEPEWRIILLRYFNPVGAHESGKLGEDPKGIPNNLMPYIQQVAVGRLPELNVYGHDYPTKDGSAIRDYIHVMDLADGHIAALRKLFTTEKIGCIAYNLGTGHGTSVLEMVAAFEKASGKRCAETNGNGQIIIHGVTSQSLEFSFLGIYDIAQRGILISDMVSDYLSFILDQLLGYLLISACSVAILASQQKSKTASLWKVISFADFLVIATCTLLSGYKLCKRIIW
ncbi:hypothetical protein GH714_009989 [Hevea brasiliensis]|uniref:UDP-glucose 4-epimerase n=1 Tax=Hevea brasiliensis TaxID=3981 RepID=A0A6A6MHQ9_HEVBR|nr:hypothetical protein GH714_009989 [Hevea brasiliensis]